MKPTITIKNGIACLLLLIFSFSITPRQFLHDWFATHKDSTGVIPANNEQHLSHVLQNCNCDNMVAESPFTGVPEIDLAPPARQFVLHQENNLASFYSTPLHGSSLRGPPVL